MIKLFEEILLIEYDKKLEERKKMVNFSNFSADDRDIVNEFFTKKIILPDDVKSVKVFLNDISKDVRYLNRPLELFFFKNDLNVVDDFKKLKDFILKEDLLKYDYLLHFLIYYNTFLDNFYYEVENIKNKNFFGNGSISIVELKKESMKNLCDIIFAQRNEMKDVIKILLNKYPEHFI